MPVIETLKFKGAMPRVSVRTERVQFVKWYESHGTYLTAMGYHSVTKT